MEFPNPYQDQIDRYKRDADRNVFVMMRYKNDGLLSSIWEAISNCLRDNGLNPVLAKNKLLHPQLWDNILVCMEYARYGIIVFEDVDGTKEFNPNIAIELGYMLARGRPCLILKDRSIKAMPTDIAGRVDEPFDSHNPATSIPEAIQGWLDRIRPSPVQIITAKDEVEAVTERTRRIVQELRDLADDRMIDPKQRVIRLAGHLSSLGISDNAFLDPIYQDFHELLSQERDIILRLLTRGATVKCIVTPGFQLERVKLGVVKQQQIAADVLPKYDQLIKTLHENKDNPNLQIVSTIRLHHDNLHIFADRVVFIGRGRIHDIGYSRTRVVYDSSYVRDEIDEFDTLFFDDAKALLPNIVTELHPPDIKQLKDIVIKHLLEAKAQLELFANRGIDSSDLSGNNQ
jgi:hypothetical protein